MGKSHSLLFASPVLCNIYDANGLYDLHIIASQRSFI